MSAFSTWHTPNASVSSRSGIYCPLVILCQGEISRLQSEISAFTSHSNRTNMTTRHFLPQQNANQSETELQGSLNFMKENQIRWRFPNGKRCSLRKGCDWYSRATDLMTWVCLREQIVKCKFDYMGSYFESALLILQWCCLLSLTTKDLFINIENSKCLTYLLFIHDIHKELKVFLKHPLGLQMLNLLLSCNVL